MAWGRPISGRPGLEGGVRGKLPPPKTLAGGISERRIRPTEPRFAPGRRGPEAAWATAPGLGAVDVGLRTLSTRPALPRGRFVGD
jgi:hypothetical protein